MAVRSFTLVAAIVLEATLLIGVISSSARAQVVLEKLYEHVDVFYATNRKPERRKAIVDHGVALYQSPTFGSSRYRLSYGTGRVTLPMTRKFGEVARPEAYWIFSIRGLDLAKDNALIWVQPDNASNFYSLIKKKAAADQPDQAIIFIHGFNTGFDDLFVVLGSVSKDLNVPVVLFSWPTAGRMRAYNVDAETAKWASQDFSTFLAQFIKQTGFQRVTLVAHSMGSRILIDALTRLSRSSVPAVKAFNRIALVAPDLDVPKFRDFLQLSGSYKREVVLYVRSTDLALRLSSVANRSPRLGGLAARDALFPGVTTIDLSTAERTNPIDLGHGYYQASIYIAMMTAGSPDSDRLAKSGAKFHFQPVEVENGRYWQFVSD